jgi:hypothetical protein
MFEDPVPDIERPAVVEFCVAEPEAVLPAEFADALAVLLNKSKLVALNVWLEGGAPDTLACAVTYRF